MSNTTVTEAMPPEAAELLSAEEVVNMTAAQPSQGMNRSADQVRAAMRIYADDGRITDEGLESLVRLFALGKARGLSFDQTGRLVSYSGATMSRLFAGKYEGAMEKVVESVGAYLELEAERQKMASDLFIETTAWAKVKAACDLAIKRNRIVRIIGPSQVGKTYCLKEYMRRARFQTCYLRIPAAPTFKLVVEAMCAAVGVSSSLRTDDARPRVARAIGPNTLVVVDELHELVMSAGKSTAMKCAEWLREIFDASGCGMVLCGTSALEDDLINDPRLKGWLGQLDQRCIRVLRLPNELPAEDVDRAAEAYGIGGDRRPVENILRRIRMNRLTTVLTMTAGWCAGNNKRRERHPRTWESFAKVYKATMEEG